MSNQIEAARVRHYRERWGREMVCNFLSPPGRHALTPANKQTKGVAGLTSSKQDEEKLFHSTMSVFLTFVHLYKVGHAFMVVEKKSRRSTFRNLHGTICVFADDDFFFVPNCFGSVHQREPFLSHSQMASPSLLGLLIVSEPALVLFDWRLACHINSVLDLFMHRQSKIPFSNIIKLHCI